MLELIKEELEATGVDPAQIISINFEDMRYAHLQTATALHDEIIKRAEAIEGKAYLFFDEIQEVEGWEKCVNSLRVALDCDIYITGSNAKLLSGELATYIGGRYVEFVIYPFSFAEFLELYRTIAPGDSIQQCFDLCVSSGYGRWRLANFLNDHGIKNRKGQNWHDASVGGILHNPLYKGILRSGETYAGPFEALQIIAPDHFDLAQKLMLERTNERKEHRTVPLNTTGQSLLSGNIFCGHCGGRLVLTTNGTTARLADGTPIHKKRIRYVCYNKTRRRQECTGQTGYTMHILDELVTEVLHQIFDKMHGVSSDMIVGSAFQKQMALVRSELQKTKSENTKANKEYESLKAEVLKAIQGKSALPQDVLSEMLEEVRQKVLTTSERITALTAELEDENSKIDEMKAEFNRIVSWSKIFDESPMEVKKMICGDIIKKIFVQRDYKVRIEFNINVEQFLNGVDTIRECDTYELPVAQ